MKHALKNSIKDNMHGLLECIFVEYAATRSYQIVWEPVPGKLPSDWEAWRNGWQDADANDTDAKFAALRAALA